MNSLVQAQAAPVNHASGGSNCNYQTHDVLPQLSPLQYLMHAFLVQAT